MKTTYKEFTFDENDIVNIGDWIPRGEYNPHNVRPWLLHDHGMTLAVVFAICLQDAIDEAVDDHKLDRYMLSADELREDYGYDDETGEATDGSVSFLGNAGEPFDIETLGAIELPNPPSLFTVAFNAEFGVKGDK